MGAGEASGGQHHEAAAIGQLIPHIGSSLHEPRRTGRLTLGAPRHLVATLVAVGGLLVLGSVRAVDIPIAYDNGSPALAVPLCARTSFLWSEAPFLAAFAHVDESLFRHADIIIQLRWPHLYGRGGLFRRPPIARTGPFSLRYSVSRRAFFRLRLRANACLTRSFWPGFK